MKRFIILAGIVLAAVIYYNTPQGYYRSPLWQMTRSRILKRDNFTCQKCGVKINLQVHHVHYRHKLFSGYGSNIDEDLLTLCRKCHAKQHKLNSANILRGER
jgi:5-methylcytosine-specific restriction endonuclease McrA